MENIANLLFEAGMLKRIPRSGYQFLGAGSESVAEHVHMMTFIAFVMAKMKVATKGRWLWARTIGSTLVGEGVDSFIFISLAFGGVIPLNSLARAIVTQWIFKSCYEAAATPVTYLAVRTLKQREGLDVFDFNTRFNPLSFKK